MDPEQRDRIAAEVAAMASRVFREPSIPKDAIFLGRHPVTNERVYIRARELDTHLHVIGGSRRGKTNALRYFCKQLLKRKKSHGEGFAIIDPHGGLAEYVLELCAQDPGLAPEVVYLDLKDVQRVLAINPLHQTGQDPYFVARCVREALIKVFDRTRSQDKPTTARVLGNVAEALILHNLTLLESRHFLNRGEEDRVVLAYLASQTPPGDLRSYLEHHLKLPPHETEAQTVGPANRLDDLIRPPVLRRMLGQERVSLDFLGVMNRGGIVLFDTSIGPSTELTTDSQDLFNALLVQQFRQAFPRRKEKGARDYDPKQWPPFTLILDEFGAYCSTEFARTLTEASKFGLRCVFAHQNLQQLVAGDGDETLLAAVLAIPNKVVFGNLRYEEAETLAKHIYLGDLNPDEIKYQPEMVTWDPNVRKIWLRGVSRSETEEPVRRTVSTATGPVQGHTSTRTIDSETGREVASETESTEESSRVNEAVSSADAPTVSTGETLQEAYVNLPTMRVQKGTPVYRTVEEQVFKAAQRLATNPRGVSVVAREQQKPTMCLGPKMDDRPVADEERQAFLKRVYEKPIYLSAEEAQKRIEERRLKLIQAASEPRVVRADGEPVAGAKLRKPFRPKKS